MWREALRHVRTVGDREHLISPNDLVALDGDRFYVTNDHGARQALLRVLEDGAGLPWSTVVFYDGSRFHTVATRIEFANGIALDRAPQAALCRGDPVEENLRLRLGCW